MPPSSPQRALQVDRVDLLHIHALTTEDDLAKIEAKGGVLEQVLKFREQNTRTIDTVDDFLAYFTPQSKSEDKPEIHGGFALCHFSEGPELDELLKKHKVTIRCIPLDAQPQPGKCFLTGRPSQKRGVFAKAY
jgi:prolyl-tRNA synthetase